MGFTKMIYLYCDGNTDDCECDGAEACDGDGMFRTVAEYKLAMKTIGWHFKNEKAYCPSCWKVLKT